MVKDHDLRAMNRRVWLGEINMIGEVIWSRQDKIGEVLMLYQSRREFQKAHVKWVTQVWDSVTNLLFE
jgi:hypothetical protein